jgi:argininosuccinate lyase/amino-acid N-acetyltransferase
MPGILLTLSIGRGKLHAMTPDPLWKGRIAGALDPAFFAFQRSLPYDARLLPQDLAVNAAWARALGRAGLLTSEETAQLVAAIEDLGRTLQPADAAKRDEEDVHTLVEAELTQRLGDLGRKIHRGKSRNDQVATDLRLWTAESASALVRDVRALAAALAGRAEEWLGAGHVVPGYTHLQQAEPVLAAHWALAHVEALRRDSRRLTQVREAALAACPLGAAALSGTPAAIDRLALAKDLGFAAPAANSIDAVSDRDFALGFLHAAHLFLIHASRLAEDLLLFSTLEFGWVRLPDAFTTGSSAMPQKRNADACELARGRAARALGRYVSLGATLRALPSGYNKDLQEDKEGVFDAFDSARGVAQALTGTVKGLALDARRARASLGGWILAAELTERLAATGLPFRDAYAAVARAVQVLDGKTGTDERRLEDLSAKDWSALGPEFTPQVTGGLTLDAAVARRAATGGTAPARVAEALSDVKHWLSAEAKDARA